MTLLLPALSLGPLSEEGSFSWLTPGSAHRHDRLRFMVYGKWQPREQLEGKARQQLAGLREVRVTPASKGRRHDWTSLEIPLTLANLSSRQRPSLSCSGAVRRSSLALTLIFFMPVLSIGVFYAELALMDWKTWEETRKKLLGKVFLRNFPHNCMCKFQGEPEGKRWREWGPPLSAVGNHHRCESKRSFLCKFAWVFSQHLRHKFFERGLCWSPPQARRTLPE